MLSYVLLSVPSPPWQRLEPPFSERVDLTSDSLNDIRSVYPLPRTRASVAGQLRLACSVQAAAASSNWGLARDRARLRLDRGVEREAEGRGLRLYINS